jgi:Ser/Thr protein kinase RdoA (MazF antagonist)
LDKAIKDRYNQGILDAALQRFAIDPARLRELDGFESFLYEYERDGEGFILRIGHSLRRSVEMIQGEVDWINHLAAGGAGVSRAIFSASNRLVEAIPDGQGGSFLATAFVKAPGRAPGNEDWTPGFCETYGRLLGRIHALSRVYDPPPGGRRPHWDDPLNIADLWRYLPPGEEAARRSLNDVISHLRALPVEPAGYGLIHQDAHTGNLFLTEDGRITLFDFDDCCYGWYIYDIAMVLFYGVMWQPDPVAFTGYFMSHFLCGYRSQNDLDPAWLVELPAFLKLREIDLYAVIHDSFDLDHLNDPWVTGYMRGRKERIDAGRPYLEFDFSSLARHLQPD